MNKKNIFTASNYLDRQTKEKLAGQKGLVIWMTGLSGSGKTTIAVSLERKLHNNGVLCKVFDGDIIRKGLNKDLGFSHEDRHENIRRIAEMSKQFVDCGIVVICGLISPLKNSRSMAREIIGDDDFIEVFVDCPLNICEQRDPKGLYKKARAGKIAEFTGIDSAYEYPETPQIKIDTSIMTVKDATDIISDYIFPQIKGSI